MKPSILIVEDHTMIAEYLASVLSAAGFEPVQAASLAQARALIRERRFDAWLCDRHLPDGESVALLATPEDRDATPTPAIALSAELDAASRQRLLDAGFVAALEKPCTPQALEQALRQALKSGPLPDGSEPEKATAQTWPVLDDEAALRICGDADALRAMRRLLAAELAPLQAQLRSLDSGPTDGLAGELHRLAASAAWCGASEVAARGAALRAALDDPHRRTIARDALDAALNRLVAALAA